MAKALAFAAGLALACLTGCSPFGGAQEFTCTSDQNCRAGGQCQLSTGYCSVADPSCMKTGQRYDEHSGGYTGQCVGEEKLDAGIDTPQGLSCYGASTGLVKPCFPAPPTENVILPTTIDTSASTLCSTVVTSDDNSTANYCVIAGATISVPDAVNVTGAKPLVLVAVTTITIGANLDAASHRMPAKIGPGADRSTCDGGAGPTNNGGGAGGSLVGLGGAGGDNAGNNGGGTRGAAQTISTLRGGCPGQGGASGTPGRGGHGGGAVYLIAGTSITIEAAINASGEGGLPGTDNGGGAGGGGSGGMIGLDAPLITNNGVVFANGGSGAEGCSSGNTDGAAGNEPTSASPSGQSGGQTQTGGDGGGGGAGGTGGGMADGSPGLDAQQFMGNTGGGGGGGGGVGVIKVYRGTLGGNHSPPPTP